MLIIFKFKSCLDSCMQTSFAFDTLYSCFLFGFIYTNEFPFWHAVRLIKCDQWLFAQKKVCSLFSCCPITCCVLYFKINEYFSVKFRQCIPYIYQIYTVPTLSGCNYTVISVDFVNCVTVTTRYVFLLVIWSYITTCIYLGESSIIRVELSPGNDLGSTFSIFLSRLFLNSSPEAFSGITW